MMKILTYKIFSLTMAFVMLITTTGFSLDLHFCQGHIMNASVFGKAKSCHMMAKQNKSSHCKKMDALTSDSDSTFSDTCLKGCCNNKTLVIERSEINKTSPLSSTFKDYQIQFIISFTSSYLIFQELIPSTYIRFRRYKPPLPVRHIFVLFQSFLI